MWHFFPLFFPKDSESLKNWTSDFGKWGQKDVCTVPQKWTHRQKHTQTDKHMDKLTYRKQRPRGPMLWKVCCPWMGRNHQRRTNLCPKITTNRNVDLFQSSGLKTSEESIEKKQRLTMTFNMHKGWDLSNTSTSCIFGRNIPEKIADALVGFGGGGTQKHAW